MDIHATDPSTIPHPDAWYCTLAGLQVAVLRDPRGGYARLTYREALEACDRINVRLPTAAEVDAIRDDALQPGGCMLTPVTLPDAEMIRAAGVAPANVGQFLQANMASSVWCELHDQRCDAQVAALGAGDRPPMNLGKWYIAGAPHGRAWLQGWWLPGSPGRYIQFGHEAPGMPGPHDDMGSRDYGTLTLVVRI